MDNEARGILGKTHATAEDIRLAWEQAALTAMEKHRSLNVPVATWDWENHQVVSISPDDPAIPTEQEIASGLPPRGQS